MTLVNALFIIWVKYGDLRGYDCVTPEGSYAPKGGIHFNLPTTNVNTLMITYDSKIQNKIMIMSCQLLTYVNEIYIIWVKYRYQ